MASMDVVSKLDMQKVDNAINVALKKIGARYDFRGLKIVLELDKKEKKFKLEVPDEMRLEAVQEIIRGCLHDQGVDMRIVDWGKREDASLGAIRLACKLKEGLDKELAKKVVQVIKDSGLKVKTSIQGDQVRVEGKSIDDLQDVQKLLRGNAEIEVPLQFDNYKR